MMYDGNLALVKRMFGSGINAQTGSVYVLGYVFNFGRCGEWVVKGLVKMECQERRTASS